MKNRRARTAVVAAVGLAALALGPAPGAQSPIPVRNDVPRVGQQEVIMMRHAYLEEGRYEAWHEASRSGVWPYFERLGARILGDFEIVYPAGDDATPGQDEALRFARYASYEHWQATRGGPLAGATGGAGRLGGDGGLRDASREALRTRRQYQQGSRGGIFLRGYLAETRPLYMPGLVERYEQVDGSPDPASSAPYPVRLGRAIEFLRGEPYGSPPVYAPGLEENYRPVR